MRSAREGAGKPQEFHQTGKRRTDKAAYGFLDATSST
jgi:hypothetical protein